MRRRITLAIVGTVAAALVLTGLGTFLLTSVRARTTARSELRGEAVALVPFVSQDVNLVRRDVAGKLTAAQQARVAAFGLALNHADATVVVFDVGNNIRGGSLPASVPQSDLDFSVLRAGGTVSGIRGRTVWAAAPAKVGPAGGLLVVVLARKVPLAPGGAPWLVLSALVVLIVAIGVSVWVSRTLIAPLRAADLATRRIADGDLSARVPEPPPNADDELADLSRAINSMAATLDRSRGLEQRFLLSVSHDLRTPLTSIRGYAEAITDDAVDDPRLAAGVILTEARRLERLVRDLLDLAKLDARSFTFALAPLDLVEVAGAAAEGFGPSAEAAGVALTSSTVPGTVAPLVADRDRLAQVVANLLENGLKFARTRLDLAISVAGPTATLTVRDDGPGIAAADLPHVFERLYVAQAEPARKESGSGLGLAISRELVNAMGGSIEVASDPQAGTRFAVHFPLYLPPP